MKRLVFVLLFLLVANTGWTATQYPLSTPYQQFFDTNGDPLTGGSVYTCQPGTTCTAASHPSLKSTYSDSTGTAANTNPIVLDAAGRANLWGTGFYKIAVYDSAGTLVKSSDNVPITYNYVTPQAVPWTYADTYASLNAAIVDIGATPTTLLVRTASFPMTGTAVVPATMSIKVEYPGSIANSTFALTINGPFSAPASQAFTGSGTVSGLKDPLPQWFGAIGDGATDDTAAIQATIDNAAVGSIIDGSGKTYLVKHAQLKSNITFQNFNLKTAPGAPVPATYADPATDFWSPVTIGGYDDTLRENIIIRNVHVDGNRVNNNTGIVGSEDGAKHGFRLVGKLNNILIENSSAKYCGSYGLFLGAGITTTDDVANIENVTIRDFVSQYNKIHGGAADGVKGLTIENSKFTYNGHAYSTDPAGQSGGVSYGNGFDFEGYGIGSWLGDIKISKTDFRYNASNSVTFYDPVDQNDVDFVARSNISITDCDMDTGTDATRAQPNVALQFSSALATKADGDLYQGITINGGSTNGEIILRAVDDVMLNTSITTGTAVLGSLDYATGVVIEPDAAGKQFDQADSTFQYSLTAANAPQLTASGLVEINGLYIQWVPSAATAFLAAQEQTVSATLPIPFPNGTLFVVPTISVASAASDMDPPRNGSGTTTEVSAIIKNGATPQDITVGFLVIGY